MSIGEVLRQRRKQCNLTITATADLVAVPRSYLSMVEGGKRTPSPQVLVRLADVLGVPSDIWVPVLIAGERHCQRLVDLAGLLYQEHDYVPARRVLGCALAISRREHHGRYNGKIYYLLGSVCAGQGQYTKAVLWFRLFERAVAHGANLDLQAIAEYNVGLTLAKLGRRVDAVKKLDEAAAAFARLHLQEETGRAMLHKANVLLAMRRYPQAGTAYRRSAYLLRRTSLHAEALLGIAIATWRLRGPAVALPLLSKIAETPTASDVVSVKARAGMASALRELGRYGDALHEAEAGLEARERIPTDLVSALLTEQALSNSLQGDMPAARRAHEAFCCLEGPKDGQDLAAMHILASALGVAQPTDKMPAVVEDAHEMRIAAALEVMAVVPSLTTHHRDPVAISS